MLEVPIYNLEGKQIDTYQVDETAFGGQVNVNLLKQAIVAYQANRRQGTAKTKTRAEISATTKRMYRQKGTGNARHGAKSVNLMKGGGHAFAKRPHDFGKKLSKNMRRAALKSAVLAKIIGQDMKIVEGLGMDAPKTKTMIELLKNLGINRSCLFAMPDRNESIYLSSRNISDLTVRITEELNAYDVATRQKMLVTREAMSQLCGKEESA